MATHLLFDLRPANRGSRPGELLTSVTELRGGEEYPKLNDVVAVSIRDFELWPRASGSTVPLLSRWRMHETHTGSAGMGHIQYVFLELPKYDPAQDPRNEVERWAYFFREVSELEGVPRVLKGSVMGQALEEARTAGFTLEEWESYERDRIVLQDARGALTMAHRLGLERGRREGKADGLREGKVDEARKVVERVLHKRNLALSETQAAQLTICDDLDTLERWLDLAITATSAAEVFR